MPIKRPESASESFCTQFFDEHPPYGLAGQLSGEIKATLNFMR